MRPSQGVELQTNKYELVFSDQGDNGVSFTSTGSTEKQLFLCVTVQRADFCHLTNFLLIFDIFLTAFWWFLFYLANLNTRREKGGADNCLKEGTELEYSASHSWLALWLVSMNESYQKRVKKMSIVKWGIPFSESKGNLLPELAMFKNTFGPITEFPKRSVVLHWKGFKEKSLLLMYEKSKSPFGSMSIRGA